MPDISNIVDVNVSLQTRSINTASFSNALFIASHNVFQERNRIYQSATAAMDDGFDADSPVVTFLTNCFAGSQSPNQVIIGRRLLDSLDLQVLSASEDEEYAVTVKVGDTVTVVTYTALVSDTPSTVATALQGLIDAVSGVTATVATDTVTCTPDVITTNFTVYNLSDNIGQTYVGDAGEDYTAAWTAIKPTLTVDAFFLCIDSHDPTDVDDIFSLASTESLFAISSSQDPDILDSTSTSDIAYTLASKAYQNGLLMYHTQADSAYPEGAIVGTWAGTNAGTVTLHGSDLVGISTDVISDTQANNIIAKNCNFYTSLAGTPWFWNGYVPDGNFADTIRFALWLEARVAESVFGLLKRKNASTNSKVPYNEIGFEMIRLAISEVLELAYARGATTAFKDASRYLISIPERTDIPTNDRANRLLPDVQFDVIYSSAVHSVIIRGNVTI